MPVVPDATDSPRVHMITRCSPMDERLRFDVLSGAKVARVEHHH
jgi:hypothetical protein